MSKVIVDIETIGFDFDSFSENEKKYLLKYAQNGEEEEEIKKKTGLYPLTGEVVTIGMLNPDTGRGMVFFQGKETSAENFEENGISFEVGEEKDILQKFWDHVKNFRTVITFNGRGFDIPYLMIRSAVHKIQASKNLMGYRYDSRIHCDLMDQMTFYGATRKYNLDFYARSFGIKSSKDKGIDGSMVGDLYKEGRCLDIARYCLRDLETTKELYEYWDKYLRC